MSDPTPRHPRFDEALALHRRYPVVDGHADSILQVLSGTRTLAVESAKGHLDFPRAREGGLSATVQAAWPAPVYYPVAAQRVMCAIDALLSQIESAPHTRLALTATNVRSAHTSRELAVILDIEGAEALHGELALLRNYHRLGARILQPVWNHRNEAAEGVIEEGLPGGLSQFGRALVREMNSLGMMLDLSHLTPPGFRDVLDLSDDPVLFTHGNCRSLYDHRRNLTDEQIRALAARKGVFGISVVSAFMGQERVDYRIFADHVDHVVQLVGPEFIAYGSDFDGTDILPIGLENITLLPNATAELLARGYSDIDLAKILGGNFLRVMEVVTGS